MPTLLHGDCLDLLPAVDAASVDLVLTDPPYPDYHRERYGYSDGLLNYLATLPCRQFIFWSSKAPFPLDYTAIHIWDKKTGCGSEYERIFERNGGASYKVWRYYLINSTVAASFTKDVFTGHPSQKPIQLITALVERYSKLGDLVLDPFMGSGTTGVACVATGRRFIGMERDAGYYQIAVDRIAAAPQPLLLEAS